MEYLQKHMTLFFKGYCIKFHVFSHFVAKRMNEIYSKQQICQRSDMKVKYDPENAFSMNLYKYFDIWKKKICVHFQPKIS